MVSRIGIALGIAGGFACAATANPSVQTQLVSGPYQPEPVPVEVIVPDTLDAARLYRVLYILPVAAGTTSRWGSGIQEAAKADIANRYGVLCVAPAFSATPWFADHPTDPALSQESHFIKTVLPWVEKNYPVMPSREGRLLLGFSKSGYGSIMLLLRHPDLFDKAVAWDAPTDKTKPDQFNMIEVFGTEENFARYAIPTLVEKRADTLKGGAPRLFLMANRDGDHKMSGVHEQLLARGVPHVYEFTEHIKHHWSSGWVPRAAELVLGGGAGSTSAEAPVPR